jgi:hypothetical protein
MPEIYVPDAFGLDSARPLWRAHFIKPDGSGHTHAIGITAPHWRIVEYDLDPTDTETILDIILHEQFIQPPDIHNMTAVEAKKIHLNNILHVKKNMVSIDHKSDHFKPFHVHHGITPERISKFQEHIDAIRSGTRIDPKEVRQHLRFNQSSEADRSGDNRR